MGCVRIVDQSGACHDEANLWSVCFRSGDQVFRAIEISPPDVILILSPKNRSKMNDRRNALYGLLQRIRIEKIAFQGLAPAGSSLPGRTSARQSTPASSTAAKAASLRVPFHQ